MRKDSQDSTQASIEKCEKNYTMEDVMQKQNFFSALDEEIIKEVDESKRLIEELTPVCEFIRKHIQLLAQETFHMRQI